MSDRYHVRCVQCAEQWPGLEIAGVSFVKDLVPFIQKRAELLELLERGRKLGPLFNVHVRGIWDELAPDLEWLEKHEGHELAVFDEYNDRAPPWKLGQGEVCTWCGGHGFVNTTPCRECSGHGRC